MEEFLKIDKYLDTLIVGAGFAGMYSLHKQKSEGEEIFTFKKREKFKLKMIVCSLIYAILCISFSSASVNLLLPMHETEKLLGK